MHSLTRGPRLVDRYHVTKQAVMVTPVSDNASVRRSRRTRDKLSPSHVPLPARNTAVGVRSLAVFIVGLWSFEGTGLGQKRRIDRQPCTSGLPQTNRHFLWHPECPKRANRIRRKLERSQGQFDGVSRLRDDTNPAPQGLFSCRGLCHTEREPDSICVDLNQLRRDDKAVGTSLRKGILP
jgi:hypothetical protein